MYTSHPLVNPCNTHSALDQFLYPWILLLHQPALLHGILSRTLRLATFFTVHIAHPKTQNLEKQAILIHILISFRATESWSANPPILNSPEESQTRVSKPPKLQGHMSVYINNYHVHHSRRNVSRVKLDPEVISRSSLLEITTPNISKKSLDVLSFVLESEVGAGMGREHIMLSSII